METAGKKALAEGISCEVRPLQKVNFQYTNTLGMAILLMICWALKQGERTDLPRPWAATYVCHHAGRCVHVP